MGFFDSLTELADDAKSTLQSTVDSFDTSTYDTNKAATIAGKANMNGQVMIDVSTIDPDMLENNRTMNRTGNVGNDIDRMKAQNAKLIHDYETAVKAVDDAGRLIIESKKGKVDAEKQAIKRNAKTYNSMEQIKEKMRDGQYLYDTNQNEMRNSDQKHETLFDKITRNANNAKDNKDKTIQKEV